MLIFLWKKIYLTAQQGKNQDTKVNKKRVFLWLGDRMCSKAVNSQLKRQSALCYSAQPWKPMSLISTVASVFCRLRSFWFRSSRSCSGSHCSWHAGASFASGSRGSNIWRRATATSHVRYIDVLQLLLNYRSELRKFKVFQGKFERRLSSLQLLQWYFLYFEVHEPACGRLPVL